MKRKHLYKTLAVLISLSLNATGLVGIGETVGYYLDTESSGENTIHASSLDMTLATTSWSTAPQELDMGQGSSTSRTVTIGSAGSIDFEYQLLYVEDMEVSNPALCSTLALSVHKNGATEYEGPLSSFTVGTNTFSGTDDLWDFTLTVPEDATDTLADSACAWSIKAQAVQPNFVYGEAYHDEEEFDNLVETKSWDSAAYTQDLIGAIEDARVDEERSGNNYGNEKVLEVESSENKNQRSFLKFALALPLGTAISDATLNIFMTNAPSLSRTYDLAPASSLWNEGSITWATQSGVLATTSSAITGTTNDRWMQFGVGSDVSSFVAGTLTNNGWRISDREEGTSTSQVSTFTSSDKDNQPERRPYLEVTFTPPIVTTDHLVINEVYYAVDPSRGSDTNNEWIELYNPTTVPIDISGWKICGAINSECDTLPASTTISSHGFAVVANKADTWTLQWPEIASTSAVTIAVGTKLGSNGLRDAGGIVELRNASSTLIDAMSYGDDYTYLSLPGNRHGDSLARIIKGYDTDTAGDFIINASPNPGTNPSQSGREVMRFTAEGIFVADALQGFPDTPMAILSPVEENIEESIVEVKESALVPSGSIPEVPSEEMATSTATSSEESLVTIPGPPAGDDTASSTEPLDLPTETAVTTEVRNEENLEAELGGESEEELPPADTKEEEITKEETPVLDTEETPAVIPEKQEETTNE